MRPIIETIPNHIGIIMDGNGRWAKKKYLPVSVGHTQGAKRVTELLDVCLHYQIKSVTLYAFSTENWKRDQDEINHLMKIIHKFYQTDFFKILKSNVRLKFIGSRHKIPQETCDVIDEMESKSKDNTSLTLNIAFNYGGREEIVHAVNEALKSNEGLTEINEDDITNNLYTKGQGDVDLLIRTSGEQRVSNFMLWQIAYAEMTFPNVLWPDFKEKHFITALEEYAKRNRRYGGR